MKNKKRFFLYSSIAFIISFIAWTIIVCCVDKAAIGPKNSSVGLSSINGFFHNLIGKNMALYTITDWLGLVPFALIFVFGTIGLIQWIKRKSFLKVDYNILILGGFYIIVLGIYVLFEFVVINHRPVLIEGILEASYPSSTTMLVMCVMPTAIMALNSLIKNKNIKLLVTISFSAFTAFMVIGRIIAGVHWISDIIGGLLISTGLVLLYYYVSSLPKKEVKLEADSSTQEDIKPKEETIIQEEIKTEE